MTLPPIVRAPRLFALFVTVVATGACASCASAARIASSSRPAAATPRAVAVAATPPAHPIEPVVLDPEAEALVRWLDQIGVPAVEGRPYVRVVPQPLALRARRDATDAPREGFVLERAPDHLVVLFDVEPVTYPRAPGGALPRLEPLDLRAALQAFLAEGERHRARGGWPVVFPPFRSHTSGLLECLLRARVAARHGLAAEAFALVALARAEAGARDTLAAHDPPAGIAVHAREDVARLLLWNAVADFARPSVARAALRTRLARAADIAGGEPYASRAAGLVALLDEMLAEDRAHVEPGDTASDDARIEDAIYHLRDQVEDPRSLPFDDPHESAASTTRPSARLYAFGLAAVPALLRHAADPHPARRIAQGAERTAPGIFEHVLTVGDQVLALIERMAAVDIPDEAHARAWWAQVGERGEFETLRAAAAQLADDHLATRLLALDRRRALPALAQIARGAPSAWVRQAVLEALGRDAGHEQLPLLRARMRLAPSAGERVTAARGLALHGARDWVAPMVAELRRAPRGWLRGADEYAVRLLLELLRERGGAAGVAAVTARLAAWTPDERRAALWYHTDEARAPVAAPTERAAVNALWLAALADDSVADGDDATEHRPCVAPTVAEFAARAIVPAAQFDCTWPPARRAQVVAAARDRLRGAVAQPAPPTTGPSARSQPSPPAASGAAGAVVLRTVRVNAPGGTSSAGLAPGRPVTPAQVYDALAGAIAGRAAGSVVAHVYRDAQGAVDLSLQVEADTRGLEPESCEMAWSARTAPARASHDVGQCRAAESEDGSDTAPSVTAPVPRDALGEAFGAALSAVLAAGRPHDAELRARITWRPASGH